MKKRIVYLLIPVTAIFLSLLLSNNLKDQSDKMNISNSNSIKEHDLVTNIQTKKISKSFNDTLIGENWFSKENVFAVSAGGVKVPISFESEIPQELQNVIAQDLNLIFGHLKEHEYLDASRAPKLSINGKMTQPDKFLKFIGKGRFFPKQLVGKVGFMIGNTMIIPDGIIQEYKQAWERKANNESQYSSLLAKLAQLNDLEEKTDFIPRDYFYISPDAKSTGMTIPDINSEQFIESFGKYTYRKPSLLDVFDGELWDSQLSGKLIAKLYVFEDSSPIIKNSMPPLIYDGEEWRFYIGLPPT